MRVEYNFAHQPWSYDFFIWLALAISKGATSIDFRLNGAVSTKWPMAEAIKRFWNYIEPGPRELGGISSSIDQYPGQCEIMPHGYNWSNIPESFPRLWLRKAWPPFVGCTVTLRNTSHRPERNSDPTVWRAFAKAIDATVIEDTSDRPISLRERFSLYAGASMNYGVQNGPLSTLLFTYYPVCIVSDPTIKKAMHAWSSHGIKAGDRPHWLLAHQHLIWQKPTLKALMQLHEEMMGD